MGFGVKKADVFELLQRNGEEENDALSWEVFKQVVSDKLQDRSLADEYRRAFQLFDVLGTGTIDLATLKRIVKTLNVEIEDAELQDMIVQFDSDKDGMINEQEVSHSQQRQKVSIALRWWGAGAWGSSVHRLRSFPPFCTAAHTVAPLLPPSPSGGLADTLPLAAASRSSWRSWPWRMNERVQRKQQPGANALDLPRPRERKRTNLPAQRMPRLIFLRPPQNS